MSLMSSPKLMLEQAERWTKDREDKRDSSGVDLKELEKEAQKLKEQERRYNQAYAVALLDLEQLREYVSPLKERLAVIDNQIASVSQQTPQMDQPGLPDENEIRAFSREATGASGGLSFDLKRGIVLNTVEKVIGTQEKL